MPTCLVLGATGFIGGHIVRSAIQRGWQVRALRRDPKSVGAIGDLNPDWFSGNLDDRSSLIEAMRGCEVVFHAAAAYPHTRNVDRAVKHSLDQTHNALSAAKECKLDRLIFTSSFTTIGPASDPTRMADERDQYHSGSAHSAYYEAKWAMEVAVLQATQNGLSTIALCPWGVFGPGDVHLSVSEIIVMTAKGKMPFYFDAALGVIDVRDVAEAHLNAVERGKIGERYILSAHNITLREGLTAVARAAKVKPPSIKIGRRLLNAITTLGQWLSGGEIGHLRTAKFWQPLSNAKAIEELGLTTRPLDQTLQDALTWFKDHQYL